MVDVVSKGSDLPLLRIGHGFDVHAFSDNRKLILGGLEIPYPLGLAGHSDADVLLHSLTDAVLGATALGDIGTWFPDTDPQYLQADSRLLFSKVWHTVTKDGWQLVNADVVIMAQRPKLAPYISEMRVVIADLFTCTKEQISIKATTTERLGFIGREEGIAVSSTVLLFRLA